MAKALRVHMAQQWSVSYRSEFYSQACKLFPISRRGKSPIQIEAQAFPQLISPTSLPSRSINWYLKNCQLYLCQSKFIKIIARKASDLIFNVDNSYVTIRRVAGRLRKIKDSELLHRYPIFFQTALRSPDLGINLLLTKSTRSASQVVWTRIPEGCLKWGDFVIKVLSEGDCQAK